MNKKTKIKLKQSILVVAMGLSTLAVADNSKYQADEKLNDAWIDGKVESALLVNTHLNNFTIDTDVMKGTVVLTGTVKSDVDKDLATEITKSIEGVTEVDNQLKIDKDTEVKNRAYNKDDERNWSTWFNDATITAAVKSKFLWNEHVDGLDINVDTMYGKVVLNGVADNSTNRNLAETLAQNTDGVREVDNQLTIK